MALKEFPWENKASDGGRSRAEIAFMNYQHARDAGLRVFETFRLSQDRRSILMTNGHDMENICLGTNNADRTLKDELGGNHIKNIENFGEFLTSVFEEIVRASQNHFSLAGDAMFFFIDRKTRSRLDFVIGDLDISGQTSSETNLEDDVLRIEEQIIYFLKKYLEESESKSYIRRMRDFFQLQIEKLNETKAR